MDVYRGTAATSVAIILTACAATSSQPPSHGASMAAPNGPIVAMTSTELAWNTSPTTTVAPTPTMTTLAPGGTTTTPTLVAAVPRSARPVPPLPADLANQPSALPGDPAVMLSDEPSVDQDAPSADQEVAIVWVVELATYRADEPIEDRRERLAAFADAPALTDGSLPFNFFGSAPDALWPTRATVDHVTDGVVTVEAWLNWTAQSGITGPATMVTVEVTMVEGRVVDSKVLP